MTTPPVDYIGYNRLIDCAMRQVVADAVYHVMEHGLNGDHHFYLTFQTRCPGVRIPSYLLARYPNEMGIVLQHKFRDLQVNETEFSVLLTFDGKPEKLRIPFAALLYFEDRGVSFSLRFTPKIPLPSDRSLVQGRSDKLKLSQTNSGILNVDQGDVVDKKPASINIEKNGEAGIQKSKEPATGPRLVPSPADESQPTGAKENFSATISAPANLSRLTKKNAKARVLSPHDHDPSHQTKSDSGIKVFRFDPDRKS